MNSIWLSVIIVICVFGGSLIGLLIRNFLPEHHLSEESKEAVKLGAGLIATLTALVLGLLVSSAKTSYDSVNLTLTDSCAKFILLDRSLSKYGPEAQAIRGDVRQTLTGIQARFWDQGKRSTPRAKTFVKGGGIEEVQDKIRQLVPQNEPQRMIQAQSLQLCDELLRNRWLLVEKAQLSIPVMFFVMLLLWLTALFLCFGLLAHRNSTVIAVFFICALSVAGAMFLIQEMNHPLSGVMRISSAPIAKALEYLGK